MDRITLPTGKTYDADYAADSVVTGNFNAALCCRDLPRIAADFTGADPITVENELVGRKEYRGYRRIVRARETENGYLITLAKEAADDGAV